MQNNNSGKFYKENVYVIIKRHTSRFHIQRSGKAILANK